MSQPSSQSEALVLGALQGLKPNHPITMERIAELIPELSWNELFHAVDTLSRRGDVVLRRKGFAYELSLPRMICVSA